MDAGETLPVIPHAALSDPNGNTDFQHVTAAELAEILPVGTAAGTVAAGNDSRFLDVGTSAGTVAAGNDARFLSPDVVKSSHVGFFLGFVDAGTQAQVSMADTDAYLYYSFIVPNAGTYRFRWKVSTTKNGSETLHAHIFVRLLPPGTNLGSDPVNTAWTITISGGLDILLFQRVYQCE